MDFRDLTPDDRPLLESFTCSFSRSGPAFRVQETIRERLADELLPDGHVTSIGAFDGDEFCGLAAWSPRPDDPEVWTCHVVAVAIGRMGKGLGTALKRAVIERASAAGILVVTSWVEEDNDAMLKLNTKLGASIHRDPEDPRFFACLIQVPGADV